jgi:hypothetical protein
VYCVGVLRPDSSVTTILRATHFWIVFELRPSATHCWRLHAIATKAFSAPSFDREARMSTSNFSLGLGREFPAIPHSLVRVSEASL